MIFVYGTAKNYQPKDQRDEGWKTQTDKMHILMDKKMPDLAKHSKRPILYVRVNTVTHDEKGKFSMGPFAQSFIREAEKNTLGKDGKSIEVNGDTFEEFIPYGIVYVDGQPVFNFRNSGYTGNTDNDVAVHIFKGLVKAVLNSNKQLDAAQKPDTSKAIANAPATAPAPAQ